MMRSDAAGPQHPSRANEALIAENFEGIPVHGQPCKSFNVLVSAKRRKFCCAGSLGTSRHCTGSC
eukprot:scaffold1600_cov229-Prasinococcus_capsulatus_cf.AAC.1